MSRISLARIGLLLVVAIEGGRVTLADEFDDFAGDLNHAWSQTNNVQMLSVINTRLSSNTNSFSESF